MAARGSWLSTGIVNTAACRRQEIGNCISVPTDFTLYLSLLSFSHFSSFLSPYTVFLFHLSVLFSKQLRSEASYLILTTFICKTDTVHKHTHLFLPLMNLFEEFIWNEFNAKKSEVGYHLVIVMEWVYWKTMVSLISIKFVDQKDVGVMSRVDLTSWDTSLDKWKWWLEGIIHTDGEQSWSTPKLSCIPSHHPIPWSTRYNPIPPNLTSEYASFKLLASVCSHNPIQAYPQGTLSHLKDFLQSCFISAFPSLTFTRLRLSLTYFQSWQMKRIKSREEGSWQRG